ncbi:MAG: potassium-transporting ATPase subunit KdpC [Planctomycetaceae bacterium]
MIQLVRISILMLASMTVLTGLLYPALVTLVAQTIFPYRANGSVIVDENRAVGSELIGQSFTQPQYFWGRLSATAPMSYNAAASSGSNLGPLHPQLVDNAKDRIQALRGGDSQVESIPVDLVTTSGSGLDPHVSPAAAIVQIDRVAVARNVSVDALRELVRRHTDNRQLGLLGEPRVNVLTLNLALDEQYPQ